MDAVDLHGCDYVSGFVDQAPVSPSTVHWTLVNTLSCFTAVVFRAFWSGLAGSGCNRLVAELR